MLSLRALGITFGLVLTGISVGGSHAQAVDIRVCHELLASAGAVADSAPKTAEAKVTFIADGLQRFLGQDLGLPEINTSDYNQLLKETGAGKGKLTTSEARKIVIGIFRYAGMRDLAFLSRLQKIVEKDLRQRLGQDFVQTQRYRDYVDSLVAASVLPEETLWQRTKIRMSEIKPYVPVAQLLLADSLLLYLGIPPVALTDISLIKLSPVPENVRAELAEGSIAAAIDRARSSKMARWTKLGVGLRFAHRAYSIALAGILGLVLAKTSPAIVNMVALHIMSESHVQAYEQKTYDSKKVVEEQLQIWKESQDAEPTSNEVEQKRQEFERMERQGVFRIYEDEASSPAL